MMDDIKSNIKVWLDDCLLHTKTEDNLLATLNFFFKKCQEHGLKLHASKCVLFASTVRYCERFITNDGLRFDPKNIEALQTMHETQNGADWVQYVAAVNWMRSAIPNYSKRVAPLRAALAKVFEDKSRRTKKAAAAVSLLHHWGPEEQAAFQRFTSSYHGFNDVGILRPGQEDLCLNGFLGSLLCWLGDTNRRGAAVSSSGRARPPASSVFVRRVQRRVATMDSAREQWFRHCRHSDQGGLPFAKS
jgi:hypothetical protein